MKEPVDPHDTRKAAIEDQMIAQAEQRALARVESGAIARRPDVADMLQAVIDRGVTGENVAALKEIVGLYERMEDRGAAKAFTAAFVALQAELPAITAKTVIPKRGRYEKFEDVMTVVGPLLQKHGFTVSFSMDFNESRVIETCHLHHVGGHSQSNSFAVRTGRKADSDTQADCMAATTAKRNALLNALNIVIRQDCLSSDDNASLEGEAISKDQAEELFRRVALTNSNREAFLKFAGAKSFAEIPALKYPTLDDFLKRKEQKGR